MLREKSGPLNSAIYKGGLKHQRFKDREHAFGYDVFMMYLDLDEVDTVFNRSLFWSSKRPALARFKKEDYFFDPEKGSIKDTVKDFVFEESGFRVDGSIVLLTNLRYFGFIINPISCYYCFDSNEQLRYVVAEVTNTPWNEVKRYLLPVDLQDDIYKCRFDKELHVSPFMPMEMYYQWQGSLPNGRLNINLQAYEKAALEKDSRDSLAFTANLHLERSEITAGTLNAILIQFPLMTVKVFAGIHWQALRLLLKKIPIVKNIRNKELVNES